MLTWPTELQLVVEDITAVGIFSAADPYAHSVPFDTHFAQGIWRSHLILDSIHARHERLRERLELVRYHAQNRMKQRELGIYSRIATALFVSS